MKVNNYLCFFIDILGYSRRIKDLSIIKLNEEVNYFKTYVGKENTYLKKLSHVLNFDLKTFSDNIFISIPYSKKTSENLSLIFSHIIDYQKYLIGKTYFLRGGVSYGKLYIDNETIFGPALVESVETEKNTIYPFIGISQSVLKLFNESRSKKLNSVPIIKIKDEQYFLDYLSTVYHVEQNPPSPSNFLSEHKKLLEYNLSNISENSILAKFVMLVKYHNCFCYNYQDKIPNSKLYFIKSVDIDSSFKFDSKYLEVKY
ncbi:MAG: hypothetical protein PVF17_02865 [Ignavibacteria bacterium]|jgi:hypothetical protein